MTDKAETTVRAFIAAFEEPTPDLDKLMSFFSTDIRYQDPRSPEVVEGAEALRREMAVQIDAVGSTDMTIHALVSDGRTVMVERSERFALRGKPVTMEGAILFEVNDAGKITRMRDYYDRGQFASQG